MNNKYDPLALDLSLAALIAAGEATRDCMRMGDDDEGRRQFFKAIEALSKATHQFALKNNSY